MVILVEAILVLILNVSVPAYAEAMYVDHYAVLTDIQLQQLTSSNLLDDGTFLFTGMADNAGICFLVDQQGTLIHQYRIDVSKAAHSVTVRGVAFIGQNILAAAYDYSNNISFVAVISSPGKITITENFSGEIEAVKPAQNGLLVCGSYFNGVKQQVPWAAKIGGDGKMEWVFEKTANQVDAPGSL